MSKAPVKKRIVVLLGPNEPDCVVVYGEVSKAKAESMSAAYEAQIAPYAESLVKAEAVLKGGEFLRIEATGWAKSKWEKITVSCLPYLHAAYLTDISAFHEMLGDAEAFAKKLAALRKKQIIEELEGFRELGYRMTPQERREYAAEFLEGEDLEEALSGNVVPFPFVLSKAGKV